MIRRRLLSSLLSSIPLSTPKTTSISTFTAIQTFKDSNFSNGASGFMGFRAYSLLSLNDLRDNVPRKQKTRKGRGIGSGKGKTAGRGHKGQKARGTMKFGFEGGQTPMRRRLPKRGFKNPFSLTFQPVGLGKIAKLINAGKIDSHELITMKTLKDTGAIGKQIKDGVRLMGRGAEKIQWPIHLEHLLFIRSAFILQQPLQTLKNLIL
ncbi:50S ribosomal protein L15-like [Populus alba x Populus x berolinensis]|nr:50S ribosomal protein L15-like [Populus alba x Populus x berolinensis]